MTWLNVPAAAAFGVAELPYGVFSTGPGPARVGVAVGDRILDLAPVLARTGRDAAAFRQPSLNAFFEQGPHAWAEVRTHLQGLLEDRTARPAVEPHLIDAAQATLKPPFEVADYVDFYASEHHAANLGRMLRPGTEPLTPNWKHLPIGYTGRAGTVVESGTAVRRPSGQFRLAVDSAPVFGPSRKLDFEAELGWVVGVGSQLGQPVPVDRFADHVFGVVLLNDWSARDIQAWEYAPLGPFLGKSFATSISAWVLPLAALAAAAVPAPVQEPELLPYLRGGGSGYDVDVTVLLNGAEISSCPYAAMYYTPAQMLAHLTSNGARLRSGDLLGSGTISGPAPHQWGSLMELSWNGTRPVPLAAGDRTFLADGDQVVLRATAPGAGGGRIRLGEVAGQILPASEA